MISDLITSEKSKWGLTANSQLFIESLTEIANMFSRAWLDVVKLNWHPGISRYHSAKISHSAIPLFHRGNYLHAYSSHMHTHTHKLTRDKASVETDIANLIHVFLFNEGNEHAIANCTPPHAQGEQPASERCGQALPLDAISVQNNPNINRNHNTMLCIIYLFDVQNITTRSI